MNCSLCLADLAKRAEQFNEHFAMKSRQLRRKQIKYADSHDCAGLMRKIGMEHGSDEN